MYNNKEFQVVSIYSRKAYFTGNDFQCQDWISNYGLGNSQFTILPYDETREYGDILETY